MIVAVPVVIPLTIPVDDPACAIAVLLLVHLPPAELISVVVRPTQTKGTPAIGDGKA